MPTITERLKALGIGGKPGERRLHSREEAMRTNSLSSIRGGETPTRVAPEAEMRSRFPIPGTQAQASLEPFSPRFPIPGTQAQAGLFTQAPQPETRSSIIDKQLKELTTTAADTLQQDAGANSGGVLGQGGDALTREQTMAIVPEALSPWRENQLRIADRIRQEEENNMPVSGGLFMATDQYDYTTNLEKARRERARLLEGNISLDRQENEERRLLSQAETGKARRELFDYGSNDMASREQLQKEAEKKRQQESNLPQNTIQLDDIVMTVGEKPTDKEIIKALEEEYTDLAAAGADTATLSELAREIDSYRDKEVSLPSIFSEAFGADNVVDTSTAGVTGNIWANTPPATFSNVQEFTGQEAIDQVEATYGPLNELQKFLVEKEGYRPGWYEDTVGVATAGVGQTGEYAAMTPIEAMNAKINETKAKVTVFDDLDLDEQKAVIDANYRGDVYDGWKDKYIAYINERTSDSKSDTLPFLKQEAYEELWNNNEYVLMMGRLQANKSVDGDNGVMKRVKKWMKTLFKDDQPTADAQAKIDAHAATL